MNLFMKNSLTGIFSSAIVFSVFSMNFLYAAEEPLLKVSGFVDPQLQMTSNVNTISRGFVLNDGALYFDGKIKDVDYKVDIPFRTIYALGPDFAVGTTRAQAYVAQKYSNGLRWKFGQFDTTFGFESNDTADIAFSRQGIVYNYTDPFVHTGLMLGYDLSKELAFNFYFTNPNDSGVLNKNGFQYGAQLLYTGSMLRGSFGGLTNLDAPSQMMNVYYDVTAGATLGALALDGEVSYNKSLTATPASYGYLLQALVTANDQLSFGVRGEMVSYRSQAVTPAPSASTSTLFPSTIGPSLFKQVLVYVGPQYALTSAVKLKFDYTFQQATLVDGATATTEHGMNLAMVYRF